MRSPRGLLTLFVVLFLCASWLPGHAVGPTIIMIYGELLAKPVVITIRDMQDFERYKFLSCGGRDRSEVQSESLPQDIARRPFVKVAGFWIASHWTQYLDNPSRLPELDPGLASQHGRLYFPTETQAAVLVSTLSRTIKPIPIPDGPAAFDWKCPLSAENGATLRQLGLAGF